MNSGFADELRQVKYGPWRERLVRVAIGGRRDQAIPKRAWINPLLPWARLVNREVEFQIARALAKFRPAVPASDFRPVFLVGCGRSGTTILGSMIGRHPDVSYFFEPWHLWAAINKSLDVSGLYRLSPHPLCIARGEDATVQQSVRLRRLLASERSMTLEKTPGNALRLGYLSALAPSARFIHIVRDGTDVVRSIVQQSTRPGYKVGFRSPTNYWWGREDAKWKALARDGSKFGHLSDAAPTLSRHEDRAAYEWLVSVQECQRYRSHFGERMLEVRYEDLVRGPAVVLNDIASFLGLADANRWARSAESQVRDRPAQSPDTIRLSASLVDPFNSLQAHLGFTGRAVWSGD